MKQLLVIIQGGSATGKSTLAKRLATDLGIRFIAKDHFKEMLYDTLGAPTDRADSTVYGKAATMAFYSAARSFLEAGRSLIIESAFAKGIAERDIDTLISGVDVLKLQIHCSASPVVRLERYESRIKDGSRHKAHPDGIGHMTSSDFSNDEEKYGALDIVPTIAIKTDNFQDGEYKVLLESIKSYITNGIL